MMDASIADRNYEWFKAALPELAKRYDDRYVIVKDEAVIADYASYDEAFTETIKTETPGTFLIQFCSLDEEKTMQVFYSPVVRFR